MNSAAIVANISVRTHTGGRPALMYGAVLYFIGANNTLLKECWEDHLESDLCKKMI